ncbi:hypothetical protein BC940DRAFT_290843 [Gongronella butleri]|nr:hypothetical protein BC940DRAFT_290843 [Gongronella butleri]
MFPLELWVLIADVMLPETLGQLSTVSRALYPIATQALYPNVHLYTKRQAESFCRGLQGGGPDGVGALVQSVLVYDERVFAIDTWIGHLARVTRNLRVLDVPRSYRVSKSVDFSYVKVMWPHLKRLTSWQRNMPVQAILSLNLTTLECSAETLAAFKENVLPGLTKLVVSGKARERILAILDEIHAVAPNLVDLAICSTFNYHRPLFAMPPLDKIDPCPLLRSLCMRHLVFDRQWSDFIHVKYPNLTALFIEYQICQRNTTFRRVPQEYDLHASQLQSLTMHVGSLCHTAAVEDWPVMSADSRIQKLNWSFLPMTAQDSVPSCVYRLPLGVCDNLVELAIDVVVDAPFRCWLHICTHETCIEGNNNGEERPLMQRLCLRVTGAGQNRHVFNSDAFDPAKSYAVHVHLPFRRLARRFPRLKVLDLNGRMMLDPIGDGVGPGLFPHLCGLRLTDGVVLMSPDVLPDLLTRCPVLVDVLIRSIYIYYGSRALSSIVIYMPKHDLKRLHVGEILAMDNHIEVMRPMPFVLEELTNAPLEPLEPSNRNNLSITLICRSIFRHMKRLHCNLAPQDEFSFDCIHSYD